MQNKLKILYITNAVSGSGGVEPVLSIKSDYLKEYFGYHIHMINLNQASSELFYNFNKNITYYNIVATGNLMYVFNYVAVLRQLVKKIKPDDLISVCDNGIKELLLPLFLGNPCPMIYERHVFKNIEIKKDSNPLILNI